MGLAGGGLTCKDLQSDLCERGEGGLVQHTDTAHLAHLHRVHTPPPHRLQDVTHRGRLLERALEEIWRE